MSYWTKNRLCWIIVYLCILIGTGAYINKIGEKYPTTARDATLVEVWTYYGNDREEWKGWFIDKQYGTGFEASIRSKTYRTFIDNGSVPQEYTVTMSGSSLDPKHSKVLEFFILMGFVGSAVMLIGKLLALVFGGRREFDLM